MGDQQYAFDVYQKNELTIENFRGVYGGIDEVGVGSIAGPMVAAMVILPQNHGITQLPIDSKLLSPETVADIAEVIKERALFAYAVRIGAQDINRYGVERCRRKLWQKCVKALRGGKHGQTLPFIIDGKDPVPMPGEKGAPFPNQRAIVGADGTHDNVSAAAILAKAICDDEMRQIDLRSPGYDFGRHKGYPTREHLLAIQDKGLCPEHRQKMTEKELAKGIEEQTAELPMVELERLIKGSFKMIDANPKCSDEWSVKFLRQSYVSVIKNRHTPTPRQQFFIKRCYKEIAKRFERLNRAS